MDTKIIMQAQESCKLAYTPPKVEITTVVLEESLANMAATSTQVNMGSDWIVVDDPVGSNPVTDGGDIYLF